MVYGVINDLNGVMNAGKSKWHALTPVIRILSLFVFCFTTGVNISFSAETNAVLSLNVALVPSEMRTSSVYVSGERVRINCSLSNATDQAVSISWSPDMLSQTAVKVLAVESNRETVLDSNYMRKSPWTLPTTTIQGHALIRFEVDIHNIYDPATCLAFSPSSRLLYEPGEYALQLQLSLPRADGKQPENMNVQSEKLHFHVAALDAKATQSILPKVFDQRAKLDDRGRLAVLLFVNLDETGRAGLIRKCIGDAEPEMRLWGLDGCKRYRFKELGATIQGLIERDKDEDVRASAMSALGAVDPVGSLPVLVRYAEQRKEINRRAAILTLGQLGDRRALPALQKISGEKGLDEDTKSIVSRTIKSIENQQPDSAVTSPK